MSEKFIRFNFNFFLIKFKFKFRFYFTLFFLQKFQKPNKILILIWITESTSRETEIIRSKSILFCSFLFASKTFKTEMTSNTLPLQETRFHVQWVQTLSQRRRTPAPQPTSAFPAESVRRQPEQPWFSISGEKSKTLIWIWEYEINGV